MRYPFAFVGRKWKGVGTFWSMKKSVWRGKELDLGKKQVSPKETN